MVSQVFYCRNGLLLQSTKESYGCKAGQSEYCAGS